MSFTVTDVPERERFEARDDADAVAGVLTYQLTGTIVVYTHTHVDPSFEGQGVGSALARAAMDDARTKGRTVVPLCLFLSGWLNEHKQYDSLVARSTKRSSRPAGVRRGETSAPPGPAGAHGRPGAARAS